MVDQFENLKKGITMSSYMYGMDGMDGPLKIISTISYATKYYPDNK